MEIPLLEFLGLQKHSVVERLFPHTQSLAGSRRRSALQPAIELQTFPFLALRARADAHTCKERPVGGAVAACMPYEPLLPSH